jgi:hypothetical protein
MPPTLEQIEDELLERSRFQKNGNRKRRESRGDRANVLRPWMRRLGSLPENAEF